MAGLRMVALHTMVEISGSHFRVLHVGVVHVRLIHRAMHFMYRRRHMHRRRHGMSHRAGHIHHAHAGMALHGEAEAEQANHE